MSSDRVPVYLVQSHRSIIPISKKVPGVTQRSRHTKAMASSYLDTMLKHAICTTSKMCQDNASLAALIDE